ncbi:PREDICTED: serine/threonine-protein phosphatase 2A regulatory subunit B'' subunit gamma-like [Amphimedon queenslandica]|uniref:Serine/threonine-protein phosphatase 2A regulatory subunit B'' subunit gamma n=1 Tax=Amphimedon queenslandica TaxID=400682 RepID=A0A1X7VV79_AMPQE|nr:PREDICTED: serine/threonine-protein phosphatase 2A regulatory subunit B'' subunit gamma-like [Amphimedon queenslandica]|eukprot:XP_003382540.1 PREDICTED: serine/threonine-protein phosphatase 2A regulatory subunit B'' subunit gamma-like [Amphimedon queenslandica]
MSWVETLKQFNADKKESKSKEKRPRTAPHPKETDEELFSRYYCKFKQDSKATRGSLGVNIPRFYSKPPSEGNVLELKLREEARAAFLQRRSSELMDNEELQNLWTILEEKNTPPDVGDEQMIGYLEFMSIYNDVSEKCRTFITTETFTKLLKDDPLRRISISQLFSYVMRKVWLQQTRIGLSLFDIQGLGFLRESDLENYILELIPTLPRLSHLEESFYSFYVCTAVRKFFFFLDPLKTGRIKIQDILGCGFLDDLLELRDDDISVEAEEANWFSAQSALKVYGQYLSLDVDHNGMLNKSELARFGTGTLTKVFIDRIFQECLTYEGEVDYRTYLDFVLAMENKREPQSLQYFFRLLDIDGKSALTSFSIKYFFRAMQELIEAQGYEAVKFEDVEHEIFDMVNPMCPGYITLQDLIKSGQGETVVNMLTDLNGFLNYENREFSLAEGGGEGTFV